MMSVTLVIIIPDVRIVQNFAYMFTLYFGLNDWPVVNQVLCIIGGFIWGASAMTFYRRKRADLVPGLHHPNMSFNKSALDMGARIVAEAFKRA